MSKWKERYNDHAYKQSWQELKNALKGSNSGISLASAEADELFRLKKIINFIQEILDGLDSELLPLNIWDNFHNQCTAAKNEVVNYNTNRNVGHLSQANTHADNLLAYVNPHMIARGKAAIALRRSVVDLAAEIKESYKQFKSDAEDALNVVSESKVNANDYLEEIQRLKQQLNDLGNAVFGDDGTKQKLEGFVGDAESSVDKINHFSEEVFYGSDDQESIKYTIKKASEDAQRDQSELSELLSKAKAQIDRLHGFYSKIYGEEISNDGDREGGLDSYLKDKTKALDDFENVQQNKYEALVQEIESLLPGATSAGLAKAYSDLKETFDKPIKHSSYLFYGAIGALVIFSIIMSIESASWTEGIKFVSFNEWDSVLQGLVYKLPVYIPVIWLAFYASKRRSESQRLQQEYAHKEALAKSYHSYKKQIEELSLEDSEMMKGLIAKAIDTISYNASVTLDKKHGDKTPTHHVAETVVDGIINKARSKTSV